MKIQVKSDEQGIEIVALEGELDFHSSTELRTGLSKLVEKKASRVVVDFKKVSYIDSSGLAAFIELFQQLKRSGAKLALYHLSPAVRGIFEVARLDSILKLARDEKEALAFVA